LSERISSKVSRRDCCTVLRLSTHLGLSRYTRPRMACPSLLTGTPGKLAGLTSSSLHLGIRQETTSCSPIVPVLDAQGTEQTSIPPENGPKTGARSLTTPKSVDECQGAGDDSSAGQPGRRLPITTSSSAVAAPPRPGRLLKNPTPPSILPTGCISWLEYHSRLWLIMKTGHSSAVC
jgi:hypothetical protein